MLTPLIFTRARRAFFNLWQASQGVGDLEYTFNIIARGLARPGRHYHDLSHVVQMLWALNAIRARVDLAQEWAVWFHDIEHGLFDDACVEASARIAFDQVRRHMPNVGPERVADLVRATAYRKPVTHLLSQAEMELIDADFSILGQSPGAYQVYCAGVEAESRASVGEQAYLAGRLRFVSKMLDPNWRYHTAEANALWLVPARANLAKEQQSLALRLVLP